MTDKQPPDVYDVLIIGGGPAGLTTGIYASRAGLRALLIEGMAAASQITVSDRIENYPGFPEGIGGFELIDLFRSQALKFGLEIVSGDVETISGRPYGEVEGWSISAGDRSYGAFAVVLATGAQWRHLGVPGEEHFAGRGVSYCATCDGPLYRGRNVVVAGGGDSAIQEAIFLANFAKKVTVVHRRDQLRAAAVLQKRAFANEKIEFAWNSVVEEIAGTEFVEKVRIRDVKTPDRIREIDCEGVFIFVGLTPNTGIARGVAALDDSGYVIADGEMKTSAKGIFACGDCIQKSFRQVITACGDGAAAAHSAQLYIETLKGDPY
jgi:thioredoxin reductase (NADPH)